MEGCDSSKMDLLEVSETKPSTQASKRGKVIEKTVVKVKISASAGNLKNEGLPYDFWSWRKYGQKPIKGSPFPRGYYKCSTSKGCSAKKQVERCRSDASLLIITYTSSHNHPGPTLSVRKLDQDENTKHTRFTLKIPRRDNVEEEAKEYQNQPQVMMINQMEEDPFEEATGKGHEETMLMSVYLDEEPTITCSSDQLMALSSTSKLSEENDFFDELEELLPISSAFNRTNLFYEIRIPIVPSRSY